MAKRQTNTQLITRLMTFSRYGALAQLFIIDALAKHSKAVAEAPLEALGGPDSFIAPAAWKAVAQEIHDAIQQHLGSK